MTPVVRYLLIACVVVFGLQYLLGDVLELRFALWPPASEPGAPGFMPWQIVSYAFLHGGATHLLFNMFALYMFGPDIERLLGSKRFLIYYFVCVVGAALAQLLVLHMIGNPPVPTVGASGGIFGLLLAYGMAFPRRKLMLIFPPIPMPAWLFVTLVRTAGALPGPHRQQRRRGAFRAPGRNGGRPGADLLLALAAGDAARRSGHQSQAQ